MEEFLLIVKALHKRTNHPIDYVRKNNARMSLIQLIETNTEVQSYLINFPSDSEDLNQFAQTCFVANLISSADTHSHN